jgi:hypothetical protein
MPGTACVDASQARKEMGYAPYRAPHSVPTNGEEEAARCTRF